ncbi:MULTISPECIES: C40 family peptidase [unclassified Moraxella]|uniref:C40 family peptidase n=1 Tax=unclassified Moraxella TaxID=2685852 RepID=UPI003AF657E8
MNFLQKTLLTVLPCVMLNVMPSTAMANDSLSDLMNRFGNNSQVAQTTNKAQALIDKAKQFIGLPYRYGGTSPTSGFDCSGFMQYVFKGANINLPRTSGSMAQVGQKVSRDELKAGDMVFFATRGGSISHVGMYVGEGRFIHSPSTGKSIQINSLTSGYYANTFVTARRVLDA